MLIAIVTIKASKATPQKALSYITNPLKAEKIKSINLDPNRDFNEQMQETAKLWNKAQTHDSRKYAHLKLSFHPEDSRLNKLTEEDAMDIATTIVKEFFPSFESVLSVHVDKDHLHVHAIINAVDPLTGKMLNMRSAQYRALKDRVQVICAERGLSSLDWREATQAKRKKERTDGPVVRETFAEQRMRQEGKTSIKTKLRAIINESIMTAKSFDEFQENLKQKNVILTRATSNTISYKLSEFRPYRGDTLGQDFTMQVIQKRIAYNTQNRGIDKQIKEAEMKSLKRRNLTENEKQAIHNFGQLLGMRREEVEQLIDTATSTNSRVISQAWTHWRNEKERFYAEHQERIKEINAYIDRLFYLRQKLKHAEWLLHPCNVNATSWGVLFAMVFRLSMHTSLAEIEKEITRYKAIRDRLYQNIDRFKKASEKGIQSLKSCEFSVDEYLLAISQMHTSADDVMFAALDIPPERRWILNDCYEMVRVSDLLEQQRLEER